MKARTCFFPASSGIQKKCPVVRKNYAPPDSRPPGNDGSHCAILSWMPKVDRPFSPLLIIFGLLLDALRFIRLSVQARCTLAAENLFLRTVSSVPGAPRRASATQDSCQVDPRTAFQSLSVAAGSDYRHAGNIHPLASTRLSTVLEVEIEASGAASHSCRTPETDRGNG